MTMKILPFQAMLNVVQALVSSFKGASHTREEIIRLDKEILKLKKELLEFETAVFTLRQELTAIQLSINVHRMQADIRDA